jgi:hypothetical protein
MIIMETLLNVFLYIHSTIVNLSYKSNIIIMMVTVIDGDDDDDDDR